jgi:hypothetical protein
VLKLYCKIVSADWKHDKKEGSGKVNKTYGPTQEVVDAVEEIMENESKTSTRHLSQQVNLPVETCRAILKKDLHLYPYRMTSVPELSAEDAAQRLEFSE